MPDKNFSILSTRPLDDALIAQAAQHNIKIDQEIFIEIKKCVSDATSEQIKKLEYSKATVVFTSMNAVEALIESLKDKSKIPDWKIYCMGGATFSLVKKYWHYENVLATAKNASELAQKIIANNHTEVVFFCGNKRREELPELLRQQSITVNELIIYETIETIVKIDKFYDSILFFSPSAVHSFFENNIVNEETLFFAIGETTAAAIRQFCNNNIIVSNFPSKDQMVEQAIKMIKEI